MSVVRTYVFECIEWITDNPPPIYSVASQVVHEFAPEEKLAAVGAKIPFCMPVGLVWQHLPQVHDVLGEPKLCQLCSVDSKLLMRCESNMLSPDVPHVYEQIKPFYEQIGDFLDFGRGIGRVDFGVSVWRHGLIDIKHGGDWGNLYIEAEKQDVKSRKK